MQVKLFLFNNETLILDDSIINLIVSYKFIFYLLILIINLYFIIQ